MNKNYRLTIWDLDNSSDLIEYKELLKKEWSNNVYYSIEHLQYFATGQNKLMCFVFKKEERPIVLMPLILREIVVNDNRRPCYDVISPYGYSGPLFKNALSDIDRIQFWEYVDHWYRDNNIITEFIRFSLTENHKNYSADLINSLSNVKGALHDNFEEQWKSFLPKVRNNYRKAESFELKFKMYHQEKITKEIIGVFNEVYIGTMNRNNANSLYFFSPSYFENLIQSNLDNFSIAIVYHDKTPISVELIINIEDTIFAFLGGTDSNFFSYRPNDFLRVKVIKWAIEKSKKYYVLGGGMKDNDGLHKNKKSLFPKDEDVMFCTGRKVINQSIYDELCTTSNKEYSSINKEDLSNYFFPYYRSVN